MWSDRVGRGVEAERRKKERDKEFEERNIQYQRLRPADKTFIAMRREGESRNEATLRKAVQYLEGKIGNTISLTLRDEKGRMDFDLIMKAVEELELKNEDIKGFQKLKDTVKILCNEDVIRNLEEYNSRANATFYANRIKEREKNNLNQRFADGSRSRIF